MRWKVVCITGVEHAFPVLEGRFQCASRRSALESARQAFMRNYGVKITEMNKRHKAKGELKRFEIVVNDVVA